MFSRIFLLIFFIFEAIFFLDHDEIEIEIESERKRQRKLSETCWVRWTDVGVVSSKRTSRRIGLYTS